MQHDDLIFGFSLGPGGRRVVLSARDLTHMHLIGTTGYGKSSLLAAICVFWIMHGRAVALLDPTGLLSRQILERMVALGYFERYADAFSRLLYLDIPTAHELERYLPFNILAGAYDPYTAADIVLEGFKRVWPALQEGTSTNIEMLVKLGSYVLAVHKLPLVPYLDYLLTDPLFRQRLLAGIDDMHIRKWFTDLKLTAGKDGIAEIVHTTLKRSHLLSFHPVVRYPLAQKTNLLNFADLLGARRSVILNLRLADPEAMRLLGSLFTVQAEVVAKTRGKVPLDEQDEKYLFVLEEVQNFLGLSGQAVENMFAESRRANVCVIVAHQHWGQLPDESVRGALNQCGIVAVFNLKESDAKISAGQLGFPYFENWPKPRLSNLLAPYGATPQYYSHAEQRDLHISWITQLAKREAFVRLPGNRLEKIRTLEVPTHTDLQRVAEIEAHYLQLYFRSKVDIEQEMENIIRLVPAATQTTGASPAPPGEAAQRPMLAPDSTASPAPMAATAPTARPDDSMPPSETAARQPLPANESTPEATQPEGKPLATPAAHPLARPQPEDERDLY